MLILKTFLLFVLTALAEIAGCDLPIFGCGNPRSSGARKLAKAGVPDKKL
jgi:hypothetical protein